MKLYKTTITYELETLTERKLDKDELERIKHNIQINLNTYNRLNSNGRLVVSSKEITL
jgi:hypothetical protein